MTELARKLYAKGIKAAPEYLENETVIRDEKLPKYNYLFNQAAAEFALKQAQVERDTFASLADERATRDAARTAALDAEQLAHNAAETTRADLARQTYFANLYATAAADKSLTQADAATQLAYIHSLTAIGHQFVTDSVNADAAHAETIATTAFFAAYGERDGEAYSQDDRFADDQQAIADYEDALRSADHDYAVDFTTAQTARDDAAANACHRGTIGSAMEFHILSFEFGELPFHIRLYMTMCFGATAVRKLP